VILLICAAGSWALFVLISPTQITTEAQARSRTKEATALSVASPDELLGALQAAVKEANDLQQLLGRSNVNYSGRVEQLSGHIKRGIAAADQLSASTSITDEQRQSASQSKFRLLYQGATFNREEFLPLLEQYSVQLLRQDAKAAQAALASAALVELKYLKGSKPDANALPAIIELAKSYPQSPAAVTLFEQLGKQFEDAKNREAAMDCYRTGTRLLASVPQAVSLRNRLASLERIVQTERGRAQAREEKIQQVRRQLGDIDNGYFVIYAHDDKASGLYEFEYHVLRGSGAVVTYVCSIKRTWKWEMVSRFPETSAGFTQASALADKLKKERTFVEFSVPDIPVFQP